MAYDITTVSCDAHESKGGPFIVCLPPDDVQGFDSPRKKPQQF